MKLGVLSAVILLASSVIASPPAEQASRILLFPDPNLPEVVDSRFDCSDCPHGCSHAKLLAGRFRRGENPDGSVVEAGLPVGDTDLLHNDLTLEIDPFGQTLSGRNVMTIRSLVDGLSSFRFRLGSPLAISAVRVNGVSRSYSRADSINVDVSLGVLVNNGQEFSLEVVYAGTPVGGAFGAIEFTSQGGNPVVSTLSETVFAYTWWPNKDDNRDKSTADLRYIVPANMSVASNGSLVAVTPASGGRQQWHWRTNYPTATYLYSFAVTTYNRFSSQYDWGGGVMPLEFFIYPGNDTSTNRNSWLRTVDMLAAFRPVYGLYPFINEKYGIYQFPFGGGMEHQTMTGQGTFSESVTAHELAHQWWGDMVTCAFWNDIWLNEGFATYGEALWFELKPGSTGAPALHSAMNSRRPSSVNGTVYRFEPLDVTDINLIFSTSFSYRKPAWVLHMLRHVIGDAAFFQTLAEYRAAFEFSSATTEDFRAIAEQVSGRDLQQFFTQWIYQSGAPAYRRASQTIEAHGQTWLELYITQVQSTSNPTFAMPMDIAVTVGGTTTTSVIWTDARAEHLLIPVSGTPSTVAFDPTPWILATSNQSTTFIPGPPKIVSVSPLPGASAPSQDVPAITLKFHRDVTAQATSFTLVGDVAGPISFALTMPDAKTAVLTPAAALPPDHYVLRIYPSITGVGTGLALDAEIDDPKRPSALPSGDGVPGGIAEVRFTIEGGGIGSGCIGDADGDRDRDFGDIASILANFGSIGAPGSAGDADNDGDADFADASAVLSNFGLPCS